MAQRLSKQSYRFEGVNCVELCDACDELGWKGGGKIVGGASVKERGLVESPQLRRCHQCLCHADSF